MIQEIEKKSKEDLIYLIQELQLKEKKANNKIITLNTEIRFMQRHMKKVRDLIDKSLKTKIETNKWENKNDTK